MKWAAGRPSRSRSRYAVANELILVVEDNDKNRKLVRDVLTFKGYEIIEAETGEEGVRLAHERHPSLVLMDIRDRRDRGAPTAASRAGHSRDSHHGHDRVRDDRGSAEDHGRRI